MRVLHVITDRDRRGAQVFATDLAAGLQELDCDGDVVALTKGSHGDLLDVASLGPGRRSPTTWRELRRQARGVDVVVAHGSATLLACVISLAGTGVPFVYRQISDPLHWAASWPRRLRVALLIRRARAIVALAPSASTVLQRHYRLPAGRITVIPNAVPGAPFTPAEPKAKAGARAALGLPEDCAVALYVGALAEEKGVDLVVAAAAEIPDLVMLIVGDGPEREHLQRTADERAPGRVKFTGPLADPLPAYHAADMMVLPSRAGDSMPAVLIEAGLCALPAVTTPVGAITDVVIDGVTGRVVPIGDGPAFAEVVRGLAHDQPERTRLGGAARKLCSTRFTIEATAPQWIKLLRSVIR